MDLSISGRPIHTRNLDVELKQRADRRWGVHAVLVDLRKAGFVPIAGDLQMSGLLHHMLLHAVFDPSTRELAEIRPAQPAVAFEPSALSRGDSCRDPIQRIESLSGSSVDSGFGGRLDRAIAGPRGCAHLLALARWMGSACAWAQGKRRQDEAHRPGERIFRRSLSIDGHQSSADQLNVGLQLTEVHFAAAPELARPLERFAAQSEVRAATAVALPGFELRDLRLAERARDLSEIESADWSELTPSVAPLNGTSVTAGMSRRVLGLFEDRPTGAPVVDALLQLGPGIFQCFSSLNEHWPALALRDESRIVCGGATDSCYMWRRGGALDQARREESSIS